MIDFGRDVCGSLATAGRREWLVTNGRGGFAMGTVSGVLTRRYHGLLIAALDPPLGRTLLVAKAEETLHYDGAAFELSANHWASGVLNPQGFRYLERFRLDGTTPVWHYACADALLEKRIWMQPGASTTYVQYRLRRGGAVRLVVKLLVNYRDYHGSTSGGWKMRIDPVEHGLRVTAYDAATPFVLLHDGGKVTPAHDWYRGFHRSVEAYRGLDADEDHLHAATFEATLQPGEALTLVCSTETSPPLDGEAAFAERQAYEHELLQRAALGAAPGAIEHLVVAADQFIVRRPARGTPDGYTVIAGYPWFGDWGRDTMIALPGLCLATGRSEVAATILRTFACFVEQGMCPNRFPDATDEPEYNTVDATLWFIEAVRAVHAATGDDALLEELFPVLREIVEWHQRGTRYGIRVDPQDGLLRAGEPGVQLTWMDAKVGDWVVTPRIGKPVEINALWYNTLRVMADFADLLGEVDLYSEPAQVVERNFERFWSAEHGYLFDVIDGPNGDDISLRPNQLFAVSLPHTPLPSDRQRAVVDVCARHLLTSHGLRSLSAGDPSFVGRYGGPPRDRDGAYHQGTVWSWLIGPFVAAHLRVYDAAEAARAFLEPLLLHLRDHGLGSISEVFDGDPPHTPRGCPAQAWGVAEVLRAYRLAGENSRRGRNKIFSSG